MYTCTHTNTHTWKISSSKCDTLATINFSKSHTNSDFIRIHPFLCVDSRLVSYNVTAWV